MGILRGLIGFMFGLVFGGTALVAVAINLPQIGGGDAPDKTVKVEGTAPAEIVNQPDADTPEPAVAEEPELAVTQEPVEVVEEPVAPEPEVAQEEPAEGVEPEVDVAIVEPEQTTPETVEQDSVEEPEPETPKIVWQSEQTDEGASTSKFNLPTISADEPAADTEEKIEESAVDTGISVGQKPSSSIPSISQETSDEKVAEEEPADSRALEVNATEYESQDRPLLGVILLDVGDKGLSVEKLKKLNAPLTIAIRIDASDASARALAYHAAGFEVIAMASDDRNAALNQALNTGQIESALEVMFTTVPHAIGLLDSAQAKIQKNSRTAKAVVKDFVETGHGLITYAKGLNSVDRQARVAGVRTAMVARTLDANSENKALMVRYLDRASLDAGRDGVAIVLGTTEKNTVATIAVWLLSSKGQSVSVAPASAVLLGR